MESDHQVVLVDELDRPIGTMDKMLAHKNGGILHRAVSCFLFASDGNIFLQRRAAGKYHFANKWSNACCTHPYPGEIPEAAMHRRVLEEVGIRVEVIGRFPLVYRCEDPSTELAEWEYDHIFVCTSDELPSPDPNEVSEYRFVSPKELAITIQRFGASFTPWFLLMLERSLEIGDSARL